MHDQSIIEVKNISFSYGGLDVLHHVSFSIKKGEKVALIGPNGAGKSTLINVLTGLHYAFNGVIKLDGKDVSKLPPYRRCDLGLGRSFQINALFFGLTLLENVLIALKNVESSPFQMFRPMMSLKKRQTQARELLEMVGLWEKRNLDLTSLSYGDQRKVEVALAMASNPGILLLDEPSAGLTGEESSHMADILRLTMQDAAVLFAAHDMDFVFELGERVIVLYYGKIIADGTPEQIEINPEVREIYMGA